MDGTASLIYLLAAKEAEAAPSKSPPVGQTFEESLNNNFSYAYGAVTRGDSSFSSPTRGRQKGAIALVFTGDEFADGGNVIAQTLQQQKIKASFFFTGKFYRNNNFKKESLSSITLNKFKSDDLYAKSLLCSFKKRCTV